MDLGDDDTGKEDIAIVTEIIGALAGLLTTVAFIPQVLKVIRERDTSAISLRMYLCFTLGVALWMVYGLLKHSPSVTIANMITLILAGTVLGFKLRFDHGVGQSHLRKSPK